MDRFVLVIPKIVPIATPVIAECPRASEKKAMRLFTIIVPNIPNSGVIMRIASIAFFIKSYSIQENGSSISIILYILSILVSSVYPLLSQILHEIPHWREPPLDFLRVLWSCPKVLHDLHTFEQIQSHGIRLSLLNHSFLLT